MPECINYDKRVLKESQAFQARPPLYHGVAIIVAACIFFYEIFHSYILLVALAILMFLLVVELIRDERKLNALLKANKYSSKKEIQIIEDNLDTLHR